MIIFVLDHYIQVFIVQGLWCVANSLSLIPGTFPACCPVCDKRQGEARERGYNSLIIAQMYTVIEMFLWAILQLLLVTVVRYPFPVCVCEWCVCVCGVGWGGGGGGGGGMTKHPTQSGLHVFP